MSTISHLGIRSQRRLETEPVGEGASMSSSPERVSSSTESERGAAKPPITFQMPFEPGEVIAGKYRIQNLIGTGGVGFVVAATHEGLDDSVALKFLKPEFANLPEAVTRFTIEARASFKIKNEHVARVLDVDTLPDGTPFMVMELLEGRDLRSILETHRNLPVELAVDFVLQCCEALAAAHACHIIHRDIKPENLFVSQTGDDDHIKVLDFGISKVALTQQQTPQRKTRATALTMMAVGTPPYMSPEQVRASNDLDARADIWSLGCVLYELISGSAPFERMSMIQACAAVLEDEPLPLREVCPDAPEALESAVMRCLRKKPAERYADIAEFARAIVPFGARSVQCAERCGELLAEGVRRSDPGYRPSEAPLRRSTPMRFSTGTGPAKALDTRPGHARVNLPAHPPANHRHPLPAAQILATTPGVASGGPLPVVARVVQQPQAPIEASIEMLTEADLQPTGNRWILAAVAGLTIMSGAYLAVQYAESRAANAHAARSAPAGQSATSNIVTNVPPEVVPAPVAPGAAPAAPAVQPMAVVAPPPPVAPPVAPAAPSPAPAAKPEPTEAAPRASAAPTRPTSAKPVLKVSPAKEKEEDIDVGF